ncbi:MAG: Unknown protein [uncultured Sulfurovum sp.]|uniref:Lipoprotein n=1 Tax=uncultured Sulfurovum sp. TaxID=269237 RepID=A0A6S6S1I1_9BACT|nr:MAG: Unknown protein [uncultured Sulfurovum sp.]
MKNLLLSTVLAFGMMTLTTGCSNHAEGASKCGASKCGTSSAKKCGDAKDTKKCGSDSKCGAK